MHLNRAMIIGNLTRDPESRATPSGQTVSNFAVATNRVWTDAAGQKQEMVEYHNIVAWRRLAEICNQYLRRGSKVYIEGRLQTRSWDGQDGIKRYRTEIIAENMIMLDSKSSGPAAYPSEVPAMSYENPSEPPAASQAAASNSNEEVNVEEVPF